MQSQSGVQARAMLVIVKTLRSQNVAQWSQLASRWLAGSQAASHPRVTAEFTKLFLSSQRLQNGSPDVQVTTATQLQGTTLVSPQEFLSAIKEQVRASCFSSAGVLTNWQPLVDRMAQNYGVGFRAQATHSVALSYMMGKRHDLAGPVLQANIAATPATDPLWSKSVSALARMQTLLGHHAQAATWFWTLSQNAATSQRFQLYALLNWVQATFKSTTATKAAAALARARPLLQAAIAQVQDYVLLLDLGRQLSLAAAVRDLAVSAFDRGTQLAQAAFTQAPNAGSGAVILSKLAQRQSDLQRYGDITTFWEGLSSERRGWLWSTKGEFWEYLALVFNAYDLGGNTDAAEDLATTYLNDPATPPMAAPTLAVPYGLYLLRNKRVADGLQAFRLAVSQNPSTTVNAAAYYWLALSAWNANDHIQASNHAASVLLALGQRAGKLGDRQLTGKALLIQAGMNPTRVSAQAVYFDIGTLQQLLADLRVDLASLL